MFFRKKKEEPHKGDVMLAKGIYLKEPIMKNGHIMFNCFLRCLIVFLLVWGCIGGFLSAFNISYNYVLVICFYFLLSMYFSFLYSTSKFVFRDIGYVIFFGLFVAAIYVLRVHANSGLYEIINSVLQEAQTFFGLSGVREYEVQIDNSYLTVAIVAIFIGMVEIIVLNIWIYSSMSLIWTVFLTFPILFIPLYMKLSPDFLYVIALSIGYLAVIVFKANGHFLAFAWDSPLKVRGRKKNQMTYTQDGSVFKQVLLTVIAMLFCLTILIGSVMPAASFERLFKSDKLREQTADTIGNFVMLGFAGLYNQYSSTGGMSGGRLGGISNVRPDYQPDLIVTYTPYSNEAVYLKGYTGGIYGDNQWENLYEEEKNRISEDDVETFEEESMKEEALYLRNKWAQNGEYGAEGLMLIQNVGADISYLYFPYYTLFENYSFYENHSLMPTTQGIGMQAVGTYQYYPQIVWDNTLMAVTPSQMDTSKVNDIFLDVPDKNKEVIDNECDKIGLNSSMTEAEIIDMVRMYFEDNIPYTLKPGATPRDEDFINYFLTENRKGYCAHFASAATLIFREMGIPARYVEGYAFSFESVLASDENTEQKYEEFYSGYSAIGESTVMDVEVTDAMAHAWVEVYVDGFGWRQVEVTPGSNEETDENDFWSAFTNFLSRNDDNDGTNNNGNGFGDLRLEEYTWLLYVVLAIILLMLLTMVFKMIYRKARRYHLCHQDNKAEAMIACYADICDRIRLLDKDFNKCKSHSEQLDYICEQLEIIIEKERFCNIMEKTSFSNGNQNEQELLFLLITIKNIRKAIWKHAPFKKKISLIKR